MIGPSSTRRRTGRGFFRAASCQRRRSNRRWPVGCCILDNDHIYRSRQPLHRTRYERFSRTARSMHDVAGKTVKDQHDIFEDLVRKQIPRHELLRTLSSSSTRVTPAPEATGLDAGRAGHLDGRRSQCRHDQRAGRQGWTDYPLRYATTSPLPVTVPTVSLAASEVLPHARTPPPPDCMSPHRRLRHAVT